ncbi:MAG: methyltransferase domain-containing protein [Gammaproteobacteria bacterium]|nr:methyltransferase domain-containing protein [Gammaproteobacteria bacterium]NKB62749.1 methyltransferase domain-containing protein [Gammaproteobacteria bacterium]
MKKPENSSGISELKSKEFLAEAYGLSDDNDMRLFYQKWADDYDAQMIEGLGYCSPRLIAEQLTRYLTNQESKVLDIGCGTGLTSKYLHDEGFKALHGLDLSPDMIEVAGKRGIYQGLRVVDVNLPLPYDDGEFDAIISSGTFTHGHVGPEPFHEISRITRLGGFIACTIHGELWQKSGFEKMLQELENSQTLACRYREIGRYFDQGELEGWFCVYEKLT